MSKKNKKNNSLSSIARFPNIVLTFTREARDELKKVSWPTRQTTFRYTIIVIVACLAVGLIIGGIDYLFSLAIERTI